jgi:succinylglutamic semialdehyde dehydrogenase
VDELAILISMESGKPIWDSKTEVGSLATKVDASIEAHRHRAMDSERVVRGMTSRTRFIPHGVMAVIGPFNFPMSMANSHILPALLAGNAVVFKPSELTPLCGMKLAELWLTAGLPPGVLNCICGGRVVGQELVLHPSVNGVLFIGSHSAGLAILRALVDTPEKIVALEMGGNSPILVWDYESLEAAAYIILQSCLISAGQRCSAARRLIIREEDKAILPQLASMFSRLRIGHFSATPEPYYGPLIRGSQANVIMARCQEMVSGGAEPLVAPTQLGPCGTLVTPGLIDVTGYAADSDEEIFGPILKVIRVGSFEEGLSVANKTKFGLAAGIVTQDRDLFESFFCNVRAGIVNWNQQLTGATTFAPFGGLKQSGNCRPAGYMSADYCSVAVASFEVPVPTLPDHLPPGVG